MSSRTIDLVGSEIPSTTLRMFIIVAAPHTYFAYACAKSFLLASPIITREVEPKKPWSFRYLSKAANVAWS